MWSGWARRTARVPPKRKRTTSPCSRKPSCRSFSGARWISRKLPSRRCPRGPGGVAPFTAPAFTGSLSDSSDTVTFIFHFFTLHCFNATTLVAQRRLRLLGRGYRDEPDCAVVQRYLEPIPLHSGDVDRSPAMELANHFAGAVGPLVHRG